jgi:cysteinylglycine-S-conjugate dipeptidase
MLGECAPGMVFVLQGEEEVGSPAAHQLYPDLDLPVVDLWLEETGYFELDGSQRLLVRRITATTEPWVRAAVALAESQKRTVCRYDRYLNKAFGEQQCPFLAHLVGDTTYRAIGPNDPESRIHRPDESLAIANLAIAVEQFQAVMTAAAGVR